MTKPFALYVIEIGLWGADSPYQARLARTLEGGKKWLKEDGFTPSREPHNKGLWERVKDGQSEWARFYENGEKLKVID